MRSATRLQLIEELADHEDLIVSVPGEETFEHVVLGGGGGGDVVAIGRFGQGVAQTIVVTEADSDLGARRRRDPAHALQLAPRHVEAFGADQREHVWFLAVLPHEGGGQPQAAHRLDAGGGPEHRRRQQMDLVVDDETPLLLIEQRQMGVPLEDVGIPVGMAIGPGEHVVGGDGDRPDVLVLAGVLADLAFGQGRLLQQFPPPLASGRRPRWR